jgi:hypothetical protein
MHPWDISVHRQARGRPQLSLYTDDIAEFYHPDHTWVLRRDSLVTDVNISSNLRFSSIKGVKQFLLVAPLIHPRFRLVIPFYGKEVYCT